MKINKGRILLSFNQYVYCICLTLSILLAFLLFLMLNILTMNFRNVLYSDSHGFYHIFFFFFTAAQVLVQTQKKDVMVNFLDNIDMEII